MAQGGDPTLSLDDFVDETGVSEDQTPEIHVGITSTSFKLGYKLDLTKATPAFITASSSVNGALTVKMTGAAAHGECVVSKAYSRVTVNADEIGNDITMGYWGDGTLNDAETLNEICDNIEGNYAAAQKLRITAPVSGLTQHVDIAAGNVSVNNVEATYAGITDLDLEVICAAVAGGKWAKVVLAITSGGALVTPISDDQDNAAAARTATVTAAHDAEPIGWLIYQKGGTMSESNIHSLDGRAYGGTGTGGTTLGPYTGPAGLLKGMPVLFTSSSTIAAADCDDGTKMPADAIICLVIDATTYNVQTSGEMTLTSDDANYAVTAEANFGELLYVATTAGSMSKDPPTTAGHYSQTVCKVIGDHIIDVKIGACFEIGDEDEDPDPDNPDDPPGKWCDSPGGLGINDYVTLVATLDGQDYATKAEADYDDRAADGIVTAVDPNDATHVKVATKPFYWDTTKDWTGGAKPGDCAGGSADTQFYLSKTAGDATSNDYGEDAAAFTQKVHVQMNDGETLFKIDIKDKDSNPDDDESNYFKVESTGDCNIHDAMHIIPTLTGAGKAEQSIGNDSQPKARVNGIVMKTGTSPTGSSICWLLLPGGRYRPGDKTPPKDADIGPNFLSTTTAGLWDADFAIGMPGTWKTRVGEGLAGGEFLCNPSEPEWQDETGDDEIPAGCLRVWVSSADWDGGAGWSRGIGLDWIYLTDIEFGSSDPDSGIKVKSVWCRKSRNTDWYGPLGLFEEDKGVDPNHGDGRRCLIVRISGLHINDDITWTVTGTYYTTDVHGEYLPLRRFNCYIKQMGTFDGTDAHAFLVNPVGYGYQAGNDLVPVQAYDNTTAYHKPGPMIGNEKIRGDDGTNSGSKISGNFTGQERLCEGPAHSVVDYFQVQITSSGTSATAYLEVDLCRVSDGASVLSDVAILQADSGGRLDTIPGSANNTGKTTEATIDISKMPMDPGDGLYVKYTIQDGPFGGGNEPYGVNWIIRKYLVRAPA